MGASRKEDRLNSDTGMVRLVRRLYLDFKRFGLPPVSVRARFVDTENGLELSRPDVEDVMSKLEQSRREDKDAMKYDALTGYAAAEIEKKKKRAHRKKIEVSKEHGRM